MKSDAPSLAPFLPSIIMVSYAYGFVSHRHNLFPVTIYQQARDGGRAILDWFSVNLSFHYKETDDTPDGSIVWEHFNIVQEEIVDVITEAQRLPEKYDFQFFENALGQCISME